MENEIDPYQEMRKNFLSGTISLPELRDKLLSFDQETSGREASEKNLAFLLDKNIVFHIQSHYPEFIKSYYDFLSFTEFHVAQIKAIDAEDSALLYFKNSLASAENGSSDIKWISYVRGTILYLEGKEIPQNILGNTSGRNREVLHHFNEGLRLRGNPLYPEDYRK